MTLFARSAQEFNALEQLCIEWRAEALFWPWHEVQNTFVHHKDIVAFYLGPKAGPYQGMLFAKNAFEVSDLLFIYVSRQARGQGLSKILMREYIDYLTRHTQVERIMLEVRKANTIAQKLYTSLGMRKLTERKAYYQDGEDAYIYELMLK